MNKKQQALLVCGHSTLTTPGIKEVGDTAYCRYDGYSEIRHIYLEEWRVICGTCQFGRWCGQSERDAKRTAFMHEKGKQIRHRCFVVYDAVTASGGTPRKSLISKYGQLLTPEPKERNVPINKADNEPPPF